LGKLKPGRVANARATYAQEMADDELPLAMFDTSFLQNGKAGMLLTNSKLYSSSAPKAVPLCDIMAVTVETPSGFQDTGLRILLGGIYVLLMGNKLSPKLLVNGDVVCAAQVVQLKFWKQVLPMLAGACQE
jgi:hypothetical protein